MQITVEFFGIPRARAGVGKSIVAGATLGDVLAELTVRYPNLSDCIEGRSLRAGYTANLGGERFVREPTTPLSDGDSIFLLSLDAGG